MQEDVLTIVLNRCNGSLQSTMLRCHSGVISANSFSGSWTVMVINPD